MQQSLLGTFGHRRRHLVISPCLSIMIIITISILITVLCFFNVAWTTKSSSTLLSPVIEQEDSLQQFITNNSNKIHAKLMDKFEGFDNNTGVPDLIVPNVIHFLRFNQLELQFKDAVCILAAYRNQKPNLIHFHVNDGKNFTGKYWDYILQIPGFKNIYKISKIKLPISIFDQKFVESFKFFHAGDVTRIRILMQYGGIFLDNDTYLIKSLDKYRHFEFVYGISDLGYLGTQTLISHKDARYLKQWLETYSQYEGHNFYFNAGVKPKLEITDVRPELVHTVKDLLGGLMPLARKLYLEDWKEWRDLYTIHLVINRRGDFLGQDHLSEYPNYNETIISSPNCTFTFCVMAREAYFGS